MSTVLLDTHAVHWWSAEPERIGKAARALIEDSGELAVSAISWYELAWLAQNGRIALSIPIRSWLEGLSVNLRTIPLGAAIADTAAGLPTTFPGDPADRIIYATAIEGGLPLITKDKALRRHRHPSDPTVW